MPVSRASRGFGATAPSSARQSVPPRSSRQTREALAARSGLERAVFVLPFEAVADIVEGFAPETAQRLEFSVFDPRVTVEDLPASGIRCQLIASGQGWAVTRNDDDDHSQATPTIEHLIGSPVTSRGMGTMRGLVGRYS